MKRKVLSLVFLLLLFISTPLSAEKVGLVLSGGGAKGAVHIGIIKALEENEIPIDYIAGTSIGSIVGSLYAMGYTPDEMLSLFMSKEFSYWQSGKVEDKYIYFFRKDNEAPDFMKINIPLKDSLGITHSLPNSLINPVQMNQAFLGLFSQATAQCQGDFDKLFVPFLCVASDIFNKEPVIFRTGDLGDAVRASMSFPFVFKPIIKDSIPLYDGGIYDNFPVHPMNRAWHPDFIIGSSVAGNSKKLPTQQGAYDQLSNMVMQKTEYNVSKDQGVMLKFNLEDVSLLDFYRSEELFELGYNTTMEMIDSIKNRVDARLPVDDLAKRRAEYKASLPDLVFKNIYITGINNLQKEYTQNQIQKNDNKEFTFEDFRETYFSLLTNNKIKEIIPHSAYDPDSKTFDLYLDIQLRDEIGIAFGGNISSMSANQLYLGLSYNTLTTFSSSVSLDMHLGNAYTGIIAEGKIEVPKKIPFDITGTFTYNHRNFYEAEKLFIETDISAFTKQREVYGKLSLGMPFQTKAKTELFAAYGQLDDEYLSGNQASPYPEEFSQSQYSLFNGGIFYNKNSMDSKQFPIKGQNHQLYVQFISGKEKYKHAGNSDFQTMENQSYIQINASIHNLHEMSSKFNLGYLAEFVLSSKNLWSNFTASVLQAPAFTPTPHSSLVFNEAFRANQFFAAGITPIWKLNSTFHLRAEAYGFMPIYPFLRGENDSVSYGEAFSKYAYLGELNLVTRLPFMNISLFANYYSYPKNNWNFGLNIGYLIFGPKFIR
ncbi:patatin-like phospholipase family protein [Bacteroidales bacterium OttesenSCG-928-J19]|nr:patatin-like phospholipase family protein [Bacteroidales bacterium OttesenSCG-928-J19]